MKTQIATRHLTLLALTLIATTPGYAFQDDYVWQDRFKAQIVGAERGNVEAQYDVGEMYEKGSGVATDIKRAFAWYEKSAEQGHIKAQFKVAYMYYKGQGVAANLNKAFNLMEKPANEGNVRAQYYLAQMFAKGDGVKSDFDEAFTWYSRSSLGGYKPADDALGELKKVMAEKVHKDEEAAVKNMAKSKAPVTTAKSSATPPSPPSAKLDTPTSAVEGFQPALQTHSTTASVLLNGTWLSLSKLPAEYLPSKITSCQKASETVIECISGDLQRTVGGTEIGYQTKAIIYAMKKDGDFRIAYRNNVTKITNIQKPEQLNDAGDSDEEPGKVAPSANTDSANISLGWQETEHRLECKVDGDQTVNCVKNKVQKITLKNQTMS